MFWLLHFLVGFALVDPTFGIDLDKAVRPNCTVGVVLSPDGLTENIETFMDKNIGKDMVVYTSEKEATDQQVLVTIEHNAN